MFGRMISKDRSNKKKSSSSYLKPVHPLLFLQIGLGKPLFLITISTTIRWCSNRTVFITLLVSYSELITLEFRRRSDLSGSELFRT